MEAPGQDRVYEPDGSYKHYLQDGSFYRVYPSDGKDDDYSDSRGDDDSDDEEDRARREEWRRRMAGEEEGEAPDRPDAEAQRLATEAEEAAAAVRQVWLEKQAAQLEAQRMVDEAANEEKQRKRQEREDQLERLAFHATTAKRQRKRPDREKAQEEERLAAIIKEFEQEAELTVTPAAPSTAAGIAAAVVGASVGNSIAGASAGNSKPSGGKKVSSHWLSVLAGTQEDAAPEGPDKNANVVQLAAGAPAPGQLPDSLKPPDVEPYDTGPLVFKEDVLPKSAQREERGRDDGVRRGRRRSDDLPQESPQDADRERRDKRRSHNQRQNFADDYSESEDFGQDDDAPQSHRRHRRSADDDRQHAGDRERRHHRAHGDRDTHHHRDEDLESAQRDRARGGKHRHQDTIPDRSNRRRREGNDEAVSDHKKVGRKRPLRESRSVSSQVCKEKKGDGCSSSPSQARTKPRSSGFDKKEQPPEHNAVREIQMAALSGVGGPTANRIGSVVGSDGQPMMPAAQTPGANAVLQYMMMQGQTPGMGTPGMMQGQTPGMGRGNPMTQGARRPVNPGPMMRGDWTCPGCGDHVFARHYACRFCNTRRPIGTY